MIDAFGHFGGGFVGEGDGEDGVGRDVFLLDEPGDAMSDDAGFAGVGACEDKQGAFGGLDSGTLFGIEMVEKRVQSVNSWGDGGPESSLLVNGDLWRVNGERLRRPYGTPTLYWVSVPHAEALG